MHETQALINELDTQLKIAEGAIMDGSLKYDQYVSLTGQVRGLRYARDYAQQLIDNKERDDD